MASCRPVSTISYNTAAFLASALSELVSRGWLADYAYILHDRDSDENGELKKPHYHVFMQPRKALDHVALRDAFIEPVFGSDIPLKCMSVRPSKFDEWLLYAVHEPTYPKGGSDGKYPYPLAAVLHSDTLDVDLAYREALEVYCAHSSVAVANSLLNGAPASELLLSGVSPYLVHATLGSLRPNSLHLTIRVQELERINSILSSRLREFEAQFRDLGYSVSYQGEHVRLSFSRDLDPLPDSLGVPFPGSTFSAPDCPSDFDIGERSGSDEPPPVGTSDNFLRDVLNLPR